MLSEQRKKNLTKFLQVLIDESGLEKSDNPITKILFGQLSKVSLLINSSERAQLKTISLLNYIKENWDDEIDPS